MSDINWDDAPEGATHLLEWNGAQDYSFFDGNLHYCTAYKNEEEERANYIIDGSDCWVIVDQRPLKSNNKITNSKPEGVTCFDLMFYGCQSINAPQAIEILEAIKSGKIHGVKWAGE